VTVRWLWYNVVLVTAPVAGTGADIVLPTVMDIGDGAGPGGITVGEQAASRPQKSKVVAIGFSIRVLG